MEEIDEKLSEEFVIACKRGKLERVKEIIYSDNKINIHYYFSNGHPLDWACSYGCLEIVKFLINQDEYNININLQDEFGYTGLILASNNNNLKIVKFILYQNRYPININIRDQHGKTASDCEHEEVTKTIENFISFREECHILLLIFNRLSMVPYEMIDMIIKIRKLIEMY